MQVEITYIYTIFIDIILLNMHNRILFIIIGLNTSGFGKYYALILSIINIIIIVLNIKIKGVLNA